MRKNKRKAMKNRRRIMLRSALCLVLAAGICTTIYIVHIRTEQRAVEEREQAAKESTDGDEWVDLELTYLGSAKLKSIDHLPGRGVLPKRTDGDIEYTTQWFYYVDDYSDYQRRIYSDIFEFYDADFDLESTLVSKEGSQYVMVYGVKPLWLQYQPKAYEGTPSRMGVDWDAEVSEYTMYFYSIDYGGRLSEMEY